MQGAIKSLVLFFFLVGVLGCSPNFEGSDADKAKALIDTNVFCSILVKYRVGQVSVLALNGEKHDRLAKRLWRSVTDYRLDHFRQRLDESVNKDLENIFSDSRSEAYEAHVADMYQQIQQVLKEKWGYSYPDCDMAIAMSESLLESNSFW